MEGADRWRTVIVAYGGLGTLLALAYWGSHGLPPDAVATLSLATVGVVGGQAAKSGVEAAAKAKAGAMTVEHVVEAARRAVELARPVVTRGDGTAR